ncbi:MAG: nucleotidyltransferase domain-containing protein [Methyloprofundus sp.]|nr:nucleotidyltransferase domain-containing protein [Methyloprofundus sp.]
MRLNNSEKNKIIEYAKFHFGTHIKLYLFGSRVDDTKKGGDIDLYLETETVIDLQTQLNFLTAIYKNITQRKVDLIINMPNSKPLAIYKTAKQEGILLC